MKEARMDSITLKDILLIIQRTINSVDNRLNNHGEQVAFLCLRMGRAMGYSHSKLKSLCILSMLHDIGAYKVEEQRRMTEFEVHFPHEHAIYGWLFLKYFSPYHDLSEAILYHHWNYKDKYKTLLDKDIPLESFLIHLADRVSVLFAHNGKNIKDALIKTFSDNSKQVFDPDLIDILLDLVRETDIIDSLVDGSYLSEIYKFFGYEPISMDEAISNLEMLVYAIDFRSRQTVTHSVSVYEASQQISSLIGMGKNEQKELMIAAILHDIGKITTPIEVLTKPDKLTDDEMTEMRKHVEVTEQILSGLGIDGIKKIASSHHERLDGNGYPHKYTSNELDNPCRVLAVADILSALVEPRYYKPALGKDKVIEILDSLKDNHIDANLFNIVVDNYESITSSIQTRQNEMFDIYDEIRLKYDSLLNVIYNNSSSTANTKDLLQAA